MSAEAPDGMSRKAAIERGLEVRGNTLKQPSQEFFYPEEQDDLLWLIGDLEQDRRAWEAKYWGLLNHREAKP